MSIFRRKRTQEPAPTAGIEGADQVQHIPGTEKALRLALLLSQQNDFQEILRLIASEGLPLFNADSFTIVMANPTAQSSMKTLLRQGAASDDRQLHLLRMNITGWMLKHGEPFLAGDLASDNRFTHDLFAGFATCSAMCVPLQNDGAVCGHILVTSANPNRRFGLDDIDLLVKCAAVWAAFLNNSQKVARYFTESVPDDVLISKYAPLGLLGRSQKFKELLHAVDAAARCDVRVFLEGQSGSGKECVARAIHTLGKRNGRKFVAIDCGAFPEQLVESELFGHVKGAFTGADEARKGLLEEAHEGTLFIDEIENLPVAMQAKLLRVLQEGEVRAIGSDVSRKVDVRIISASQTPAVKLVRERRLREDLFYRLHVYPITLPTLNERSDDILLLANQFLRSFAARQRKKAEAFHPSLAHFMTQRTWSGNVRELENFVERMVTLAVPDATQLDLSLLPEEYRVEYRRSAHFNPSPSGRKSLRESVKEVERTILLEALRGSDWNQSEAARTLGISERAIRYKISQLHLAKE